MNNAIKKYLIINKLDLPQDILDLLKLFLFVDIKSLFNKSVLEINNCLSRYNFKKTDMTDENEHWSIGNIYLQLQATNCKICGGYKQGRKIDNKYLKCIHFDH